MLRRIATDYVRFIFAIRNPTARIASFHLAALAGAEVHDPIRIAENKAVIRSPVHAMGASKALPSH